MPTSEPTANQSASSQCGTCQGSGEFPTESGTVDCPDCGGEGQLPSKSVLTEWRLRDLELAAENGPIETRDVRWLLAEIRNARIALTEVITLAEDVSDESGLRTRLRYAANRALELYPVSDTRQ
jgi:hypothetical protein